MAAMCCGRMRQQPPTSRAPASTQVGTAAGAMPGLPVHRRPTASQPSPLFG